MPTIRTSVIIPVFNGADRLAEAVASARAQLCDDDEIVIVDDGSTDGTPDVIHALEPSVLAIRQDNAGSSAARNRGLQIATGEFIAFLDHDDTWTSNRHAVLSAALNADLSMDIVMGLVRVELDRAMPAPAPDNRRYVTTHRPWHLDALLMRRRVFERVGLFDETLRSAEDAQWYMRARQAGLRYGAIDHVAVNYRLHDRNLSRDVETARSSIMRVLRDGLDRRRSSS